MRPGELLQAIERYLAAPDPTSLPGLTQDVHNLADMVGWADGPIDPKGRFTDRLNSLLTALRAQHEATSSGGVAALHDSLAELADAIVRHDQDFVAGDPDDDTAEV
jgi:hypothetical protein